jgi:PilZ domain
MSPLPERIGNEPLDPEPGEPVSPSETAPAEAKLSRGLGMEARITSHTWEIGLSAMVQDFTPGEVILLLDDHVTEGTPVTVQLNTCSFDGEILFCRPLGARYETHVSFNDVDETGLRRTPRFPVRIPARIFSHVSETPYEARIVDISGEGLGIELPESLPMQTTIAVESDENVALGVVRHCRELSSGLFRVGVQLHHIVRRDPDLEKASSEAGWMNKFGFGRRKKADRPKGWS